MPLHFGMFFLYILYSPNSDKYYVGHTNDPVRRLKEQKKIQHSAKVPNPGRSMGGVPWLEGIIDF